MASLARSSSLCLLATVFSVAATAGSAQQIQYSSAHRDAERAIPQTLSGGTSKLRTALSAGRTPLSIVTADFDGDGTADLVTGYGTSSGGALLLQRGNPRALAPTPTEWAKAAAGELVAPYAAKSEAIALPISPSLLATAKFSDQDDLIAAAKGDSAVYFLQGHGDGTFSSPEAIALSGSVTSLTVWRAPSGDNLLVAGICGASGCGLQFLGRDGSTAAFVKTRSAVTAIDTGIINAGYDADLAVIAGDQVLVLDGESALSATPILETLPVTGAVAIALGTFVPDHHPGLQIAVLDSNATLHVITRAGIDATYDPGRRRAQILERVQALRGETTRTQVPPVKRTGQPWVEAETLTHIGPGGKAIMLRARLTGSGNDDLAVMAGMQYITIAHPLERTGGLFQVNPVVTVDSTSAPVIAATAARVSADARKSIVMLGAAVHALTLSVPNSNRTMYVSTGSIDAAVNAASLDACRDNTSSGQTGCTLRAAVTVANLDRGATGTNAVDTIYIPAGTYNLSALNTNNANVNSGSYATQNPDYLGSVNYHLELDASMNLVGASSASTTINANQIDQVIAIDYGSFYATSEQDFESAPVDVFLSGLTIKNGKNPNVNSVVSGTSNGCNASQGYCNAFGGNMQWTVEGPSNLVMNNVNITLGMVGTGYGGGGISISYDSSSNGTAGPLEIDNSTLTNNQQFLTGAEGGGAIEVQYGAFIPTPVILTSDTFSGNRAANDGGAIEVSGDPGQKTITGSTFIYNTASGFGGGVSITNSPSTITVNTFTNNTAAGFGGAIRLSSISGAQNLYSNTFLGNTVSNASTGSYTHPADGAGVCVKATDSNTSTYTFHYNRFHGNAGTSGATPPGTGLAVGCDNGDPSALANVNATDNWFGCNPSTATYGHTGTIAGTGCDTAGVGNATNGSAVLTVSPYTVLTLGLSATTINQGNNVVATASLGRDSSGTEYAPSGSVNGVTYTPDAAYLATPITAFTLTNTSSPTYNPSATAFSASASPSISYAAATATAATNSPGTGTATVTVDGQTVTANYNVVAPDLTVTSTHGGNFRAGDTTDTYTLTVANVGTSSTSGTVTLSDTLPSGFTATGISGGGWTCVLSSVTCTRSDALAASVTYPAVIVTVSISGTDAGTYTNTATVSGGNELNTSNDTGNDSTAVVGQPTITEAFSPSTIAPNATSTVTYTLGNPSANSVSLTGVAFSDPLQSTVKIVTAATTTCTGGTVTGAVNGTTISLSGASIAAGATCTVTAGVTSPTIGSYPDSTGNVNATNSNTGGMGSATLTVAVTPTKLVYTATPATPITAGGNAGTISVALEDASGNVATNNSSSSVQLVVTGPNSYSQTYSATAANGIATFNLSSVPLTTAGSYTYTASSSGLTSAVSNETVNPGAFAALSGAGPASFTAPGQTGSTTITAKDSYGNAVMTFTGTVTFTSNDPLATLPAAYTYVASDNGSHTFTYSFGTAGTARTLTATSGSVSTTQSGIIVNDCILFVNANGTLSRLTDAGVPTSPSGGYPSGGTFLIGAATDSSGDIWWVNTNASLLVEFSKTGTALSGSGFSGGGLNLPTALAVDGLGQVWVVNNNGTLSLFTNAGAPVTTSSNTIPVTGTVGTNAVAIDISGNLWVTSQSSNTVTEIVGGAAPTPTLANGVLNGTTGSRP